MQHRIIKFDLSKYSDCKDHDNEKILSFTIRTTDGEDETYSSKRAESKNTGMTEELIRFSLICWETAKGKQDAKQPFEAFDRWSTKARNFVVAAWKKIATPDEKEIADFFASATDVE